MFSQDTVSILSYNVFIGPICPIFPWIPRLLGSTRLQKQIHEIHTLSPDILLLQEVYCKKVLNAYQQVLHKNYTPVYSDGQFRKVGCFLWYALLTLTSFSLFYVTSFFTSSQNISIYLLPIFSLLSRYIWHNTVPHSFCTGDILGGTVIFYKNMKLKEFSQSHTTLFREQRGDILNTICPRAYQIVPLMINRKILNIVHVHTNCMGLPSYRKSQILEALHKTSDINSLNVKDTSIFLCGDFNCDSKDPSLKELYSEYHFLDSFIQGNGKGDGFTWNEENILTKGFMRNYPNIRCDMILCKPSKKVSLEFLQSILVLQGGKYTPPSDHYGLMSTILISFLK